MGELKKLGIKPPSRNTVKKILKAAGFEHGPRRGDCATSSGSTLCCRRPRKWLRARPISRRQKLSKIALGWGPGSSEVCGAKSSGGLANSRGDRSLHQIRGATSGLFGRFFRLAGFNPSSRIRQAQEVAPRLSSAHFGAKCYSLPKCLVDLPEGKAGDKHRAVLR